MNPYTAPGIGLDETGIIKLISHEFGLPDEKWITLKCRETKVKVARQLLMTCLIDHCGYSQQSAGGVCLQTHCNARHAKQTILEIFWYDPEYGERVRVVYNRCVEIKRRVFVL